MKNLVKTILLIFLLASAAQADTHTSVGDGAWHTAGTWNIGVPHDGDTVLINTSGHDVIYDEDMTGWVTGVTLTVAAGATLTVQDDGAAYYLMTSADITLNGTLQVGTSVAVPFTGIFTLDFNNTSSSIVCGANAHLYLYCIEPTIRKMKLSGAEVSTQVEWSVDDDVTADIWTAPKEVAIIDGIGVGFLNEDVERRTIVSSTETTLTVTAGLTANKQSGAYVVLLTRNIILKNSTDYIIKNALNSDIYAFIDCANALSGVELSNVGGTIWSTASAIYSSDTYGGLYLDCLMVDNGLSSDHAIQTCYNIELSVNSFIGGYYIAVNGINVVVNGTIFGCITAYSLSNSIINGDVEKCYSAGNITNSYLYGNLVGCGNGSGLNCNACIVANCTLEAKTALFQVGSASLYNVVFTCTTEFDGYNDLRRNVASYVASFNHDGVENSFKAWCRGGIVTSQTTSPPTGYTIYYDHEVEVATYPCFRQYQATVLPGTAIEVSAVIRNTDGIDVSSTSPIDLRPRLEIIDVFADPLVDNTQTALDSDAIADADGSDTSWQSVDVIWANTGDAPRQVYVRIICYSHDASTHTIDEAWSVADYQDQIGKLYSALIPVPTDVATANTTTSFTLTGGTATADIYNNMTLMIQDADDAHWELRSISDWTAGRVITVDTAFGFTPAAGDLAYIMGTAYGAPVTVDNGAIADEVVTHMDANSTDLNTIIEDTSAFDTAAEYAAAIWNALTNAYGGAGTYGQAVEDVLADTTAYDTDAEHAAAIWNALMATYSIEASFGGEVQQLDPNITLIKAVTDILPMRTTTVSDANDANSFTVTAGAATDYAYWGNTISVKDATDAHWESRMIISWTSARVVVVDEPFAFTPANGDVVVIWSFYLSPYIYNNLPKRISPAPTTIDRTAGSGAGTKTLDVFDNDP